MSFWSKLSGLMPSDIFAAVRKGNLERVKALLESNPGLVFKTDSLGWTPLHTATHWHQKDAAEVLLANQAEVNVQDEAGVTPLHFAVDEGRQDLVELLLASNADVNIRDHAGKTPWQWAVAKGHADLAAWLRQHGGRE